MSEKPAPTYCLLVENGGYDLVFDDAASGDAQISIALQLAPDYPNSDQGFAEAARDATEIMKTTCPQCINCTTRGGNCTPAPHPRRVWGWHGVLPGLFWRVGIERTGLRKLRRKK